MLRNLNSKFKFDFLQDFSQRAAGDAQLQAAECGGPMHGHKDGQGQNFASYSSPNSVLE